MQRGRAPRSELRKNAVDLRKRVGAIVPERPCEIVIGTIDEPAGLLEYGDQRCRVHSAVGLYRIIITDAVALAPPVEIT